MNNEDKKCSTTFISVPDRLMEIFFEHQHLKQRAEEIINATDFLIYLIFLKYYNNEKGYAWITNETIAKKLNKVKRAVDNSVSKLMRCRFIYRYKPSDAQQLENKALYGSYCTRPLIRMTSYDKPLIDERKEYELKIKHAIEIKEMVSDSRRGKARRAESSVLRSPESGVPQLESRFCGAEIDDDVPF